MENQELTNEITLKYGYEDSSGNVHKIAIMRPIKTKDIIALHKDARVKNIARDKSVSANSDNPVAAMGSIGAMSEMFSIAFCRVVISIGDITDMKPEVFTELYQTDMMKLIAAYNTINGLEEDNKEVIPKELDPLA